MAKRDYYEVLGVPRTATPDEGKLANRRLARLHHPDMNKDNPKAAEEKFKELSEADQVLVDPERRQRDHQLGFTGVQSDFGPGGFTWQNFTHVGDLEDLLGSNSDFFQQLFNQGFGADRFGRPVGLVQLDPEPWERHRDLRAAAALRRRHRLNRPSTSR